MALSLESAGFNELNELFEFEICDSLVRAADSPEIGWMEWERRLQDCGRSEAVLAHSNGNGRPTCTRHNPIRLSIVNGGTLDGKAQLLLSFFLRLRDGASSPPNLRLHSSHPLTILLE